MLVLRLRSMFHWQRLGFAFGLGLGLGVYFMWRVRSKVLCVAVWPAICKSGGTVCFVPLPGGSAQHPGHEWLKEGRVAMNGLELRTKKKRNHKNSAEFKLRTYNITLLKSKLTSPVCG